MAGARLLNLATAHAMHRLREFIVSPAFRCLLRGFRPHLEQSSTSTVSVAVGGHLIVLVHCQQHEVWRLSAVDCMPVVAGLPLPGAWLAAHSGIRTVRNLSGGSSYCLPFGKHAASLPCPHQKPSVI